MQQSDVLYKAHPIKSTTVSLSRQIIATSLACNYIADSDSTLTPCNLRRIRKRLKERYGWSDKDLQIEQTTQYITQLNCLQ